MYLASFATRLLSEVSRGTTKLVAMISFITHDETPLPMRAPASDATKRVNVDTMDYMRPSSHSAAVEEAGLRMVREKGTMKLVQSMAGITILHENVETAKLRASYFPLPAPLGLVDRATGPALHRHLEEHLTVPCLEALQTRADVVLNVSVRDSASANKSVDEMAYAAGGDAFSLCVPCAAHGVANSQGFAFGASKACVSGVIACSLLQRAGGAVTTLRSCIAEVLFRNVEVIRDCPLSENDERMRYRSALFDLCIGRDSPSLARRANLELLLNGDLQSPKVQLHVRGRVQVDLRRWAECTAALLLPSGIPVFPRRCTCRKGVLSQVWQLLASQKQC